MHNSKETFKEKLKKAALITKKALYAVVKYLYGFLNDNGKPSVYRSLILIFIFSMYMTLFQYTVQDSNPLQLEGTIYLNFVPIFLMCCLLYFTIGKNAWVFSICVSVLSVLHAINHYKIKFRDEPLTPMDFSLGKEAGNIIKGYDLTLDPTMKYIIYVVLVTIILSFLLLRNKRPNWKICVGGIAVTLAVSVVLFSTVYKSTKIYNSFQVDKNMYKETDIISAQGLIYSLINKASSINYERPNGYSVKNAEEILSRYPQPEIQEDSPDVIAIMCESFTDIQPWVNVDFNEKNPYTKYNRLKTKGCYGEILVAGFGGATAVTEFEFLTANSTSLISTAIPIAYNTHIKRDSFSIARYLNENGYKTEAIHPGKAWFYNRQNVYPRLGFETFTSREDLPYDTEEINYYVSDKVTSDLIISKHRAHTESNPEQKYFSFTVTIQNHAPYSDSELYTDTEYIPRDAGLSEQEYNIINNYLYGVESANNLIKEVYDYINTLERPAVLIIFGDHLPYLDSEQLIYQKLGLDIKSKNLEAYTNMYSTNYLIVGNDLYLKNNTPSIDGQQTLISSNYLSLKLFQYANMELPQFLAFTREAMEYTPVINKRYNTVFESGATPPTESDKKLKEYKILEYYNLRDYPTKQKGENQ